MTEYQEYIINEIVLMCKSNKKMFDCNYESAFEMIDALYKVNLTERAKLEFTKKFGSEFNQFMEAEKSIPIDDYGKGIIWSMNMMQICYLLNDLLYEEPLEGFISLKKVLFLMDDLLKKCKGERGQVWFHNFLNMNQRKYIFRKLLPQ